MFDECRDAEVEHLDVVRTALLNGEQDVGGLQVSMNDAVLVHGAEGVEDLPAYVGRSADGDGLVRVDDAREAPPPDVLHHDERFAACLDAHVHDLDHAGVANGRGSACLTLEALEG